MDHRTIVSFFTCQLVWVNRYIRKAILPISAVSYRQMPTQDLMSCIAKTDQLAR